MRRVQPPGEITSRRPVYAHAGPGMKRGSLLIQFPQIDWVIITDAQPIADDTVSGDQLFLCAWL